MAAPVVPQYRDNVVEDAGGLLAAAAAQRAEEHLHQVLGVLAALFRQPHHHLLQQELHCRVLIGRLRLLLVSSLVAIHFHQRLRRPRWEENIMEMAQ